MNLDALLAAIKADYLTVNSPESMVTRFNNELKVKAGKKYIKVISGGGVWGFIVNTHDDAQFAYGDILKPASWAAPARNKARGNVVKGDLSWVNWTGPEYLK